MTLRKKLCPTPNALASGQTATFDMPLGLRYHVIWLEIGYDGTNTNKKTATTSVLDTTNEIVGDIRVKINGKVQRVHTACQLNQINGSNGSAFALKTSGAMGSTGYRECIPIFFAEPWRQNDDEVRMSAWNLAGPGVESFQIEVDFKTITSPYLSGFYEFEPATGVLGSIAKCIRQTVGVGGTVQDFNTIDRRDFLQAIHLWPTVEGTPHYVNKLKLTANGVEMQDVLTSVENQAVLLGRGMNPDTAAVPRFDLVMDYDDPIAGALPLGGLNELTLHVEYNTTVTGNMVMAIIRAGPPE